MVAQEGVDRLVGFGGALSSGSPSSRNGRVGVLPRGRRGRWGMGLGTGTRGARRVSAGPGAGWGLEAQTGLIGLGRGLGQARRWMHPLARTTSSAIPHSHDRCQHELASSLYSSQRRENWGYKI